MRLIALLLIIVLVGSYLWWSRDCSTEVRVPGNPEVSRPPELARWLEAGLLTTEQADAIVAFEDRRVTPRKIPLFTEALGYVGAVLALAGGGVAIGQIWDDLTDVAHVAILAAATILALGAGWLLRSQSEPAIQRLMSVLWALSVGGMVATTTLLFVDVVELSDDALALFIGGIGAAYAAVLWWPRRQILQQVALFGTGLAAVIGLVVILPGDAAAWVYPLVVADYGGLWLLLGLRGLMVPTWSAVSLGAVVGVWGPSMGAAEHGWLLGVGLVSAVLLMVLGVTDRKLPLLAIGAVGSFIYLISSVIRYFGDTIGIPTALAIVGVLVLAVAVGVSRAGPFRGSGWHRPTGHPA